MGAIKIMKTKRSYIFQHGRGMLHKGVEVRFIPQPLALGFSL